MQVPILPIDLVAVVAVFMGTLTVLIPIAGLTARFALKPMAEAIAKIKSAQGTSEQIAIMQQRLELMEQQMSAMESDVHRLKEVQDFQARLQAPKE
jgi:TolA-binding protein